MFEKKYLEQFLDIHISKVIDDAKLQFSGYSDTDLFAGTVVGFLLKTGLLMAAKGGAPKKLIKDALLKMMDEFHWSGHDVR